MNLNHSQGTEEISIVPLMAFNLHGRRCTCAARLRATRAGVGTSSSRLCSNDRGMTAPRRSERVDVG
jgi:hypothetical protein